MRVLALSDLHSDFPDNRRWLTGLSQQEYRQDVLILAGDISHQWSQLTWTLETLQARFAQVFFVPGNHDLWLHRGDFVDSLAKWQALSALCQSLGVEVRPQRLAHGPWIVPLLSWYSLPAAGLVSLGMGEPPTPEDLHVWSDTHLVRWPAAWMADPAAHFAACNTLSVTDKAPVISFSHFLPRQELLPQHWPPQPGAAPRRRGRFNFSWVAGSLHIETQLRRLGSRLHIHGHQHRNRRRLLEGVLYLSHCLGYPRERQRGELDPMTLAPLVVWDSELKNSPVLPWDGDFEP